MSVVLVNEITQSISTWESAVSIAQLEISLRHTWMDCAYASELLEEEEEVSRSIFRVLIFIRRFFFS